MHQPDGTHADASLVSDVGIDWARAATLAERVRAGGQPPVPDPGRPQRRLQRWRRAHDLADRGGWDELLSTVPGGEDGLLALLGEAPEHLAGRLGGEPGWWGELRRAIAAAPAYRREPVENADWRHEFAMIIGPIAQNAVAALAARMQADPSSRRHVAVKPVLTAFLGALNGGLVAMATRTLILELNVARERSMLDGGSGADRFMSFIEQLTSPAGQTALYAEYPVLARLLCQRAELAVEAVWELLERLASDREAIVGGILAGTDPGDLVKISFGAGDGHQGGRAVAVLRFADGARVIYKPRPLAVHARMNDLLSWLSTATGLHLRTLAVIDRGGHGWLEYADHGPCASEDQVSTYYRRLGAQMALLYAVDGTDFHFENLIACGDQPVLVDMEAVFHQPPPSSADSPLRLDPALRVLESSVMRTGLLPILVTTAEGSVDLGGLGGDPSETAPYASATWDGGGTDGMRVVRKHLQFVGAQNRPSVDGTTADLGLHVEELLAGFRQAYAAIADHRDELTSTAGLLDVFGDVEVRTVLRATQTYTTLLTEGTHPDLMRDALDRDRHLSYLWAVSAGEPSMTAMAPHELADMWAGDVPLFTSRPGSRDLWTSRGERIAQFFAETALDRVRAKLAAFGAPDLARQEWIIRAALETRPAAVRARAATPSQPREQTPTGPASDLVTAAQGIGDRLLATALTDGERISWLGLEMADEASWRVGALRWDLYSGFPGVALFLATLGERTGQEVYRDAARRSLWWLPTLMRDLEQLPPERLADLPEAHGFAGLPGLAYALLRLGETELCERAVRLCAALDANPAMLDLLSGAAGAVACLAAVHEATGLDEPLWLARGFGDRLLAAAAPAGAGIAWPAPTGARAPLTGFSHGASGIGWALTRLGRISGDFRYVEAGLAGFAYERGEFRADWGNWPDYRSASHEPLRHMYAWCHGAPGIGLARVDALRTADDSGLHEDLHRAVTATAEAGLGQNHSLCHGDLGNVELLLRTGASPDELAVPILASIARGGPRPGTPNEIETPGLMCGLAGIGYGLLRLDSPDTTPSVLLLDVPNAP